MFVSCLVGIDTNILKIKKFFRSHPSFFDACSATTFQIRAPSSQLHLSWIPESVSNQVLARSPHVDYSPNRFHDSMHSHDHRLDPGLQPIRRGHGNTRLPRSPNSIPDSNHMQRQSVHITQRFNVHRKPHNQSSILTRRLV